MRDRRLLHDVLLFLKTQDQRSPFGRLIKRLIKRVNDEIESDPQELTRLCNTFLYLFDNPKSDCQPTKAWEKLASKIRYAVHKTRRPMEEETDPVVWATHAVLTGVDDHDFLLYHRMFGKQGLP